MNKKFIICDYARANWGKTTNLRMVFELLSQNHLPKEVIWTKQENKSDVWALFEIEGKSIVVCSLGDPDSCHKEWLDKAVKLNVDIIICAARIRGETIQNVYSAQKNGNYEDIFWFQNFNSDKKTEISSELPEMLDINKFMAEAIIKIVLRLLKF